MCENVFGLLEPLAELHVGALECGAQRVSAPPSLLVHIGHHTSLTAKDNLGVVLEVDLYNLIRESEHHRVLGAHPLLHVDRGIRVTGLDGVITSTTLQLALEVLEQRHLFVQLLGLVLEGLVL